MNIIFGQQTQFEYINYKGIKSTRNVIPMSLYFGATEFHPENQWLLVTYDIDKQAQREFALKDIVIYNTYNREYYKFTIPKQGEYWCTYLRCLSCGEVHNNSNLPCPYSIIT